MNVTIINEFTGEAIRQAYVDSSEQLNELALSLDVMEAVIVNE